MTECLDETFAGLRIERTHLGRRSLGGFVALSTAAYRPEVQPALDTFSPKTDSFERALLRDIVQLGTGLQAVRRGGVEQVADQLPLGCVPMP